MNKIILYVSLVTILFAGQSQAGVFSETGHGSTISGVMREASIPRGSCRQCHVEADKKVSFPKGLWRQNDNELCFTCHFADDLTGVYPGRGVYESSTHNTDPLVVWPGPYPPARRELEMAGKCLNCHNPHGQKDRNGIIPSLLIARQNTLCLSCHDGNPSSKDISREVRKPYSHKPKPGYGRNEAQKGGNPDRYSYIGGNRYAECSDCHNAHAVAGDFNTPVAPTASRRNARVGRIRVMNGGPGTVPGYEYLGGNDTTTKVLEYQICFKCHSSWTKQPPGQDDIARLLNTNNASFHPVESQGRSLSISSAAFVGGMGVQSEIFCGDCHGSDDTSQRGPHGSQFANLLKKSYETRSYSRPSLRDDLCFVCHSFDTYASTSATISQQQASRFGKHTLHVGQHMISCYACHDSHGSPWFGGLIVTNRNPGIRKFSMTVSGGSCLPSCHQSKSYTVSYPR
jgi:predicted CXXCH cytochrome family protein